MKDYEYVSENNNKKTVGITGAMNKSYKRSLLRGTAESTGEIGGREMMIPGELDRKRSHE